MGGIDLIRWVLVAGFWGTVVGPGVLELALVGLHSGVRVVDYSGLMAGLEVGVPAVVGLGLVD